jgi:uncharacterized repeat protein (TIGR03803 family)
MTLYVIRSVKQYFMKIRNYIVVITLLILSINNCLATILTNLYTFSYASGAFPSSELVLSGNTLFGTSSSGIFRINVDGTSYTNLYQSTNGGNVSGTILLSGDTLYGVGPATNGSMLFSIKSNGNNFTNLYNFNSNDGSSPTLGLFSKNNLFGVMANGGNNGNGTLFEINSSGEGFTNFYNFSADAFCPFYPGSGTGLYTNEDGINPSSFIIVGNTVYGVAGNGGIGGNGTVFRVNIDGTCFTNLHSFSIGSFNRFYDISNYDGANPQPGLVLAGDTLYGSTQLGGIGGEGTIFKVNTDGTGFSNLFNFIFVSGGVSTNGYYPQGGLVLFSNNLYGTAFQGGMYGFGTVYKINIDGTGFAVLYNFNSYDGNGPGSLILSGNSAYGTTLNGGGPGGVGNLFMLSLSLFPIPLNIGLDGNRLILNWDNPAFSLQSASAIAGVYTNIFGATSPYTNLNLGAQMFFRLQGEP